MKEKIKILDALTLEQRNEFEMDLQELYSQCKETLNGKLERLMDVVTNINLQNKVFLRVTIEYDNTKNGLIKGRITSLHQYKNRQEYDIALAIERKELN